MNTALALASPAQRKVLNDNYGRKDPAVKVRARALYEALRICAVHGVR